MLVELLKKIDIECNPQQLQKLEAYFELLVSWNQTLNLTRIIDKKAVYQKHFFDSLLLTKQVKLHQQIICDVGTGAGFPGIVLKILFPEIKLFLVEAVTKKCRFLKAVINELGLEGTTIINARVEALAATHRDFFDIITARAVAKLNVLLELCMPLVKVKGIFIALKSEVTAELTSSQNALTVLNTKLLTQDISNWDFLGKRIILYFIKMAPTNQKYPRLFTKIKQNPL